MPMRSLERFSVTWEMAVGIMFMWPWAKPRKAEQQQVHSTAGDRAITHHTAFSFWRA